MGCAVDHDPAAFETGVQIGVIEDDTQPPEAAIRLDIG